MNDINPRIPISDLSAVFNIILRFTYNLHSVLVAHLPLSQTDMHFSPPPNLPHVQTINSVYFAPALHRRSVLLYCIDMTDYMFRHFISVHYQNFVHKILEDNYSM